MKPPLESVRIIPDDWLNPLPLADLFSIRQPIEVDLGCGKGRFLLARAANHPDINFLGIDRMLRRVRKIDNRVRRMHLNNVRLLRMEGYYAVAYLMPAESISTYYVFFPDPWPKKRHHVHRIFNPQFLDALYRTLTPRGRIHMATDHLPYFESVRDTLSADARFAAIAPFEPDESERTDFEMWYINRTPIGRCSFEKR